MREAVTDVLVERSREAEGLSRMVVYSLVAHVALVTVIALAPKGWLGSRAQEEVAAWTISLSGSPGPDAAGRNQLADRPVQTVAPPEPRQPFTLPPASKAPEMVVPEPAPKPAPKPRDVRKPADKPTTRKPIAGEEVKSGAARVETGGAAVPFGGLSSSGGDGLNPETFGLENFCCPDYIRTMSKLIRRNWNQRQGVAGVNVVKFVIRRDGMLVQPELVKPSGNPLLDLESRRAVINTRQLPPLPAEFTEPNLTILLTFEYKR